MPRRARMYVPGLPYHLVQRGNNRQACFIEPENYNYHLDGAGLEWLVVGCLGIFFRCYVLSRAGLIHTLVLACSQTRKFPIPQAHQHAFTDAKGVIPASL